MLLTASWHHPVTVPPPSLPAAVLQCQASAAKQSTSVVKRGLPLSTKYRPRYHKSRY